MDAVRNPYSPGAGQRPPELAGRDLELHDFAVLLARAANGRPVRSPMLCGLRGVGKTVLLNAFRAEATRAGWGTGKLEGRADLPLRTELAKALHRATREIGSRVGDPSRLGRLLSVLTAFTLTADTEGTFGVGLSASERGASGNLETDLTELFADAGESAAALQTGLALFLDEAQDVPADDLAALCGACHEISQAGLPLVVVGAGLPHLPTVLAAAKTYAERLFTYLSIGRLDRAAADQALTAPARREHVTYTPQALDALAQRADGYPYFIQAYGQATWNAAAGSPITEADVLAATPAAYRELTVGFHGSRWDRATPQEQAYMRAMADLTPADRDVPITSSDVAARMGRRRPSDVSVFRDGLIRKGLVYSAERGKVAFTVPHMADYIRSRPA